MLSKASATAPQSPVGLTSLGCHPKLEKLGMSYRSHTENPGPASASRLKSLSVCCCHELHGCDTIEVCANQTSKLSLIGVSREL